MLDHLIKDATVVDGTGNPAYVADVGLRDGRIAALGRIDAEARTSEDARGLVLTPGFVDPHTHYDAQLFWDPYATPSLNHGVTTVAAGNCGFTLAPLHPGRPEDADYTRRMMSKVEGMSLVALEQGAPLDEFSYPALAWADDSLWVSYTVDRQRLAWQRFAVAPVSAVAPVAPVAAGVQP